MKTSVGQNYEDPSRVSPYWEANSENQNRAHFLKYAQGDHQTGQLQNYQYDKNEANVEYQQHQQEIHHYNTEYSQVSGIQTGFKKLKNNKIQILKELKQEYEILRNFQVDQKIPKQNNKIHSETSSLGEQRSEGGSSKMSKSKKRDSNIREAQILALQKKQLEIVVSNSMKKIQELLHNQMQYKKQIHELKLQIEGQGGNDLQYQKMVRTMKKNQQEAAETMTSLNRENQRLKITVKQLTEKIKQLEGQVVTKDQEIRKNYDERRRMDQQVRAEKDKFLNLEIDYKKCKMEAEIFEKDKNAEINRLMRQLQSKEGISDKQLQLITRRLQDEIKTKDRRYDLLLEQLDARRVEESHTVVVKEPSNNTKLQFEEMLRKMREENNQNNNQAYMDSMNTILMKINHLEQRPNDELKKQIEMLKFELENLKNLRNQAVQRQEKQGRQERQERKLRQQAQQRLEKSQTGQYLRIQQLQRIINEQNFQKSKFIEQVNKMKIQSQENKKKNKFLKDKIAQLKDHQIEFKNQINRLNNQVSRLNSQITTTNTQINRFKISRADLTQSQNLTQQLRIKINSLSQKENEAELLEKQIKQQRLLYHKKQQDYQQQIRILKRKLDEVEFSNQKLKKEYDFELKIMQNEHQTQLRRRQEELEKLKQINAEIRSQIMKMRAFNETNIENQKREIHKLKELLQVRKMEYDQRSKEQNTRYASELSSLSSKLEMMATKNEQFISQSSKFSRIERQNYQLIKTMRHSMSLNEGIDHLWKVKETEYQNVHDILKQIQLKSY